MGSKKDRVKKMREEYQARRMQGNAHRSGGVDDSHSRDHAPSDHCVALGCTPVEPEPICSGAITCTAPLHIHGCYADTGNCNNPDDHYRRGVPASKPESVESTPVPVEVGQWRADTVSPYVVVEVEPRVHVFGAKVWTRRWLDGLHPRLWMSERTVLLCPVIEPPTVSVKARDLVAGMVEAGTGRVAYYLTASDRTEGDDGTIYALRPWWRRRDMANNARHDGWVDPDALYPIRVDSLPDGWAPSVQATP